jgi:hypothetical protein
LWLGLRGDVGGDAEVGMPVGAGLRTVAVCGLAVRGGRKRPFGALPAAVPMARAVREARRERD